MDDLIQRLESAAGPLTATEAWDLVELGPFGTSGPLADLFAAALGGSLDAALALAERVLPSQPEPGDVPWEQWLIELVRSPNWRREPRVTWDCTIGSGLGFGGARVTSLATPALALSAAILKAARTQKGESL